MKTNIVPMAGLGSRFVQEGYLLPKPLIPVSGEPMLVQAIRNMPPADKWIFLVRQEHIDDFAIDSLLRKEKPGCHIIPIKDTTEGQACTCMLAMPHVDPSDSLYIGSCDTAVVYDKKKYTVLIKRKDIDCIMWTMTRQPTMKVRPEKHGWCRLEEDEFTIKDMSVKVPISNNPYNDHAVIGSFWFRAAQDFIDSTNLMIKENYRANGEFFVDSSPVFMKKLGKRSVIFDVDEVISWGTPKDLYLYQYIEYCLRRGMDPKNTGEAQPNITNWKKFFRI